MLRRNRVRPGEQEARVEPAVAGDHERFWGGDDLADTGTAHALAAVAEDESLEYPGGGTRLDTAELALLGELVALATWAEDKACLACRATLEETHDPARLEHDECRTALRVARLLSRYPIT
jgi:hypothetical protein